MTGSTNMARIFCIGQNYIAHIKELSNPMPDKPVIFMRPLSCLVPPGEEIHFPKHGKLLHYEVEVVVRIGKQAKEKGLPWEEAKSFEQSAPLGKFLPYDPAVINLKDLNFTCKINGELRQNGNIDDMLFGFERLVAELSKIWTLRPGDMIYTGTPSGVGPLQIGDEIEVENDRIGSFSWSIIE
jgi:acylpyruvate hydrolase